MKKYEAVLVSSEQQENVFMSLLEEGGLYKQGDGKKRYKWFYTDDNAFAYILYAKDGTPIGTKGFRCRRFEVDNKHIMGCMSVDTSVIKQYRQLGPALFIHQTTLREILEKVDFVYTMPNHISTLLYKRSKILPLFYRFDRFVKILKSSAVLQNKFKFIQPVIDGSWNTINRINQFTVQHFPHKQQSFSYNVFGDRSDEYLTWRYYNNPLMEYKHVSVEDVHIIYYENKNRAYVVDIVYPFGNIKLLIHALILLEDKCKKDGLDSIIICLIGAEEVKIAMHRLWYKQFPPHTKTIYIGSNNKPLEKMLLKPDNSYWFLGDEDAN